MNSHESQLHHPGRASVESLWTSSRTVWTTQKARVAQHSPTTSPPLPGREVIAKLQGPSGPDALRLPKQFSYKILEKIPPRRFVAFGYQKARTQSRNLTQISELRQRIHFTQIFT